MRRSLSLRIATVALIAMTSTPVFARGWDDGPINRFGRVFTRIIQEIKHLPVTILEQIGGPK